MAQANSGEQPSNDLDTFFNAKSPEDLKKAAETVAKNTVYVTEDEVPVYDYGAAALDAEPEGRRPTRIRKRGETRTLAQPDAVDAASEDDEPLTAAEDLEGKFIAVDPAVFEGSHGDAPFVLIPANIHSYVPKWGWVAIGIGLAMLVAGVVLTPMFRLSRLTSRLGDDSEANVQYAMRQLVTNGDERTVKKLYSVAASPSEKLRIRLRAVDTMTLIEQVPEVDRALLRLELSEQTTAQVREAAVAARRQREAVRARRRISPGAQQ